MRYKSNKPDKKKPSIDTIMRAITLLSQKDLKGLGPATASAILATMHQEIPFMSDEAMKQLEIPSIAYDIPSYRDFLVRVREHGGGWATEAERELWTTYVLDHASEKELKSILTYLSICRSSLF